MSDPDVIRGALLLEQSYLYLFFASAVLVAAAGTELLRSRHSRALLAGGPVGWSRELPRRRHVLGSVVFGIGWAVADACPGPIATQIGQGIPWAFATCAGVVLGVALFQRAGGAETEPPIDATSLNGLSQDAVAGRNDRALVEAGSR